MNPIVHASLGLHIANLGFHQRFGRRASLILATASIFPDIDSVTLFISREAYLQYHRAFTHALGGWVVCGALLALFTARHDLKRWFFIDWGLWALGMAGHTAADLVNRWPIPVFYPFSQQAWAWGIISWGDEFLTIFLPVLALAPLLWPKSRRLMAVIALSVTLIYVAYRIAVPGATSSWLGRVWFGLWSR